jgi:TrmH family RNA methyltransferase
MVAVDEVISSFANPTVKRVRQLADRKYRRRTGSFVVEGLQPVWRAVTSGWPVDTLIVAPELLTNEPSRRMVDQQRAAGVRVVLVSREVFAHLSDREGPAGLAAIVRAVLPDLSSITERLARSPADPVVVLYRAGNPGNIGTILRTADAAGAAGLILVGDTADPFAPAAVKASMGSLFAVPIGAVRGPDELFGWAAAAGRPVLAVTGSARRSLWDGPLDGGSVLLLGSEGAGVPQDLVDRCDDAVAIPMQGTAESLNLATAAAVLLYELQRRRHLPPG